MRKRLRFYLGGLIALVAFTACDSSSDDYGQDTLDQLEVCLDQLEELKELYESDPAYQESAAQASGPIILQVMRLDTLDRSKLSDEGKERYRKVKNRFNRLRN